MPIINIQQLASNARLSSFQLNITLVSAAPSIARLHHISAAPALSIARLHLVSAALAPSIARLYHISVAPAPSIARLHALPVSRRCAAARGIFLGQRNIPYIHIDTTARVYTRSI